MEDDKTQLHASLFHSIPNIAFETSGPAFSKPLSANLFDNVFQKFRSYDQTQCQRSFNFSHSSTLTPMEGTVGDQSFNMDTAKIQKSFSCQLCNNYHSVHKNGLDYHMKKYHGKAKRLQCPYCMYACIEKPHLDQHIRQHTGEKPYHCDFCDFRSASQSGLRYHKRTKHEKTSLLPCKICGYKAYNSYILTQHQRKHSGDKPYECKTCCMTFSCKASLSYHTKTKHGREMSTNDYGLGCDKPPNLFKSELERLSWDIWWH